MMSEIPTCPRCDTPLSEGRPEGLCPGCLLKAGLPAEDESGSPARAFTPPPPETLAPSFPQYEILSLIGRGGMGAVYKALHLKLDRLVAIKILPREVGEAPTFEERFVREARTLARLGHRGIVTIHDFGEADGLFYFVMEYVEGRSLRELLREGRLPVEESLRVAAEICDALRYAHDRDVVHRDVKPENVLVDEDGHVRITDFGLAKIVGGTDGDQSLTGTHQAMGTPHYMAPEQIVDPGTVDVRADLFAVGVLLYEMLTGELPLGRFPPPSAQVPVQSEVDDLVMEALARDPEDRTATAGEMKRSLDEFAKRRVDVTPGSRRTRRSADKSEGPDSSSSGADLESRLVLAILIAAGVAFVASFLDWVSLDLPEVPNGLRFNAWRSDLSLSDVHLPNWLLAVDALLLAALAGGRLLGLLPTLGRAMLVATAYGTLHLLLCLGFILLGEGAEPQVRLALALMAFGTMTGCTAVLAVRAARSSRRGDPAPDRKQRRQRKKLRRKTRRS